MIYGEHELGMFGDLTVTGDGGVIGAVMTVKIRDTVMAGASITAIEPLTRSDVERLRDLCDEALS